VSGFLEDLKLPAPPLNLVNPGRLCAHLDESWDKRRSLRAQLVKNVPTLQEQGIKDANVYSWQAMAAPKGTPADIRNKLQAAVKDALNDPAIKPKLLDLGFEIVANTPEEFTKFQAAEFVRWQKLIQSRNIKVE